MAWNVWTQDCMSRIFPHQRIPKRGVGKPMLYAARGEVEAFQIGVHADPNALNSLEAEASDLVTTKGEVIASDAVEVLFAEYVPVHWHSAGNTPQDLEGQAPGFYPDPLLKSLWRGVGRVQFPDTISAWIRVRIPGDAAPGSYRGKIRLACPAGKETVEFGVKVWPFRLPEEGHFLMTNWFLTGPILKFHGLEPLTEDFWKVMAIYAQNLQEHRQNVVLTPLFGIGSTGRVLDGRLQDQLIDITEPQSGEYRFDFTNFDRWVDLFLKHGFQAIEGSHLAGGSRNPVSPIVRIGEQGQRRGFSSTQAPEYRAFLGQFLVALRQHLSERKLLESFYLHLSDEPHGDQFEPYTDLAKFVKQAVPEIHLIDAMGVAEYAPYVDHPVPLESVYERFAAESGIPQEQIWFYYCCGPTGAWPNRFIDYPLIRTRIFTWAAFRYGIPGFLHWGLNHWAWHRPHYRSEEYNPYDNTTGGTLQAGDSYLIYPPRMPQESHEPVDSIRWEIVRKAMEDYEYLHLLQQMAQDGGKKSEQASELLRLFEQTLVPNFTEHTRDAKALERFRRKVAQLISREKDLHEPTA